MNLNTAIGRTFRYLYALHATRWEDIEGYELLSDFPLSYLFEVYEDDGGGLTFCVLNQDFTLQRVFDSWEYIGKGSLKSALESLVEDETNYETWENDMASQTGYTKEELQELYNNDAFGTLIADSIGVYLAELGGAGHTALDIPD